MCFLPSGYQHGRADNWKSGILNGGRLSCPHVTLSHHSICDVGFNDVMSLLPHIYGANFLFQRRNQCFSHFKTQIFGIKDLEDVINRLKHGHFGHRP